MAEAVMFEFRNNSLANAAEIKGAINSILADVARVQSGAGAKSFIGGIDKGVFDQLDRYERRINEIRQKVAAGNYQSAGGQTAAKDIGAVRTQQERALGSFLEKKALSGRGDQALGVNIGELQRRLGTFIQAGRVEDKRLLTQALAQGANPAVIGNPKGLTKRRPAAQAEAEAAENVGTVEDIRRSAQQIRDAKRRSRAAAVREARARDKVADQAEAEAAKAASQTAGTPRPTAKENREARRAEKEAEKNEAARVRQEQEKGGREQYEQLNLRRERREGVSAVGPNRLFDHYSGEGHEIRKGSGGKRLTVPVEDPVQLSKLREAAIAQEIRAADRDAAALRRHEAAIEKQIRAREQNAAAQRREEARVERSAVAQGRENARLEQASARVSARSEKDALRTLSRGGDGIGGNFTAGLLSGGFGGGERGGGFEGLARSAGTTVKYAALYSSLGLLTGALSGAVQEFLNADDSITELNVAFERLGEQTNGAEKVTNSFKSSLQDLAATGGFNVGEAMDVAASGVRAFKDEVGSTDDDVRKLGDDFAEQSLRLAVLAKTTLSDAAGNLKAVTAGFDLAPNDTGFAQVTDAVAGAKLLGGGDETQIFQGLANSAVILKEVGFSLNESATIVSKINAETDQSGTLIANRLSRLSTILGGTTGKSFIGKLNEQLRPDQQIDDTASLRDQILQLGKAYGTASAAQQQAMASGLGGTAQARELIILLQNINGIVEDIDRDGFAGKGAEEFQKRLDNAAAILKQIQGQVSAIVVNITSSGLFDSVGLAAKALLEVLKVAKEITQVFNEIPLPVRQLAGALGLALAASRALAAVKTTGGVRGAFAAVEAQFAPGRAESRAALAERRERAGAIETLVRTEAGGGKLDVELTEAAGRYRVSADKLEKATEGLARARNRQFLEQRNLTGAPLAAAQASASAVNGRYEKLIAALKTQAAERELAMNTAEDRQRSSVGRGAAFDKQEARATKAFQREIAPLNTRISTAQAAGNLAAENQAQRLRSAAEKRYAAEITAIAGRRLIAENEAIAAAASGGGGGGGGKAGGRIAGALSTVKGVAGPLLAFAALDQVFRGIEAGIQQGEAQDNLRALNDRGAGDNQAPLSIEALRELTDSYRTAEAQIKEVTEGPLNGLVDAFRGGGARDAERSAKALGDNAAQAQIDLKALIEAGRAGGATSQLAGSIDITSADSIRASFDALAASGVPASQQMAALTERIRNLDVTAAGSLAKLSDVDQKRVAQEVALNAPKTLQDASAIIKERSWSKYDPWRSDEIFDPRNSGSTRSRYKGKATAQVEAVLSSDKIVAFQRDAERVITAGLAQGIDLAQDSGKNALTEMLAQDWIDEIPDEKTRTEVARLFAQQAAGVGAKYTGRLDPLNALKNFVGESVPRADLAAANVTRDSRLKSITTGSADTSVADGARARTADLLGVLVDTRKKATEGINAGTLSSVEAGRAVALAQTNYENALIAQADAQSAGADAALTASTNMRLIEQRASRSNAEIARIGQRYFEGDLEAAIASGSTSALNQIIESASSSQIKTARAALAAELATTEAFLLAEQKRVAAVNTANGVVSQFFSPAVIPPGIANPDRPQRADETELQRLIRERDAQEGGLGRLDAANRTNLADPNRASGYLTGGAAAAESAAQIAAARRAGEAARSGDRVRVASAGLASAEADLAAVTRKNTVDYYTKLSAVNAAKRELADTELERAITARNVGADSESALDTAQRALRDALERRSAARARGDSDPALDAAVEAARRQTGEANAAYASLQRRLVIDTTDPVATAREAAQTARAALQRAQARGAKPDVIAERKLAVQDADLNLESTAFQQRFDSAQTAERLGRISHGAFLQFLRSERDLLSVKLRAMGKNTAGYYDAKKRLDQLDEALKAASETLSGQFNLGDIKVPTPYEVRRSLGTATSTEAAVANTIVNNANVINVRADASVAQLEAMLVRVLGPEGAARVTTSPRRS